MRCEKVERYPDLVHKLMYLSQSISTNGGFFIIVPPEDYRSITTLLESLFICYGIESEVELPMSFREIPKGKGG